MGKDLLKLAIISVIVYNIIPVIYYYTLSGNITLPFVSLWIVNIIYSAAAGLLLGNKHRFKISIPTVIAIMFIPSILLFYSEAEYIYIGVYFVAATIGCLLGQFANDRNN